MHAIKEMKQRLFPIIAPRYALNIIDTHQG